VLKDVLSSTTSKFLHNAAESNTHIHTCTTCMVIHMILPCTHFLLTLHMSCV
jgi:hypothetical protein